MRRTRGYLAGWLTVVACVGLVPATGAADESTKTRTQQEQYTAGPAQAGVDCATNAGGACFDLAGDELSAGVFVRDANEFASIPFTVTFLDAAGDVLAQESHCDKGRAPVPAGATTVTVAVSAVNVTGCTHPSLTQGGRITLTHDLKRQQGEPALDGERSCGGGFGEQVSYALTPDDGRTVRVDVLVLLDGVTRERATELFEQVRAGYAHTAIDLQYALRDTALTSEPSVNGLFAEIRGLFGGTVPDGFELVHVLTTKDIAGAAGYAYCVGGARSAQLAFSMSEVRAEVPNIVAGVPAPVWPWPVSAYYAAHEIGHLLGGNHSYSTCGESVAFVDGNTPGPCDLMNPYLNTSYSFSTPNRFVVRGFALEFLD